VTSTQDIGKIVAGAHSVPLLGEANILTALEVAQASLCVPFLDAFAH
jgi:hypothetical protein